MSELMQSTEMPHESGDEQSFDAVPMSETEIGSMFDEPEAESDESVTEQPEEEDAPEAEEAAPEEPPIPAPSNWSELDKEEFEKLPRPVQEKIVAREKERDAYLTRKTQEIAEKSRSVQSLEVLGEALKNDPNLRAHLAAYNKQQQEAQAPADPIERIAWEAEQRALAKVQEQIAPVIQQMQHKQSIDATLNVVRQDPHHKEVYEEIGQWLKAMPESIGRDLYARLDSDPAFFSSTYDHFRSKVTSKPKAPVAPPAPTPVERTTKAPRLESPGAETPQESTKKRFKELTSRARSGDLDALGALFDL
jgi:hypothetical protein